MLERYYSFSINVCVLSLSDIQKSILLNSKRGDGTGCATGNTCSSKEMIFDKIVVKSPRSQSSYLLSPLDVLCEFLPRKPNRVGRILHQYLRTFA